MIDTQRQVLRECNPQLSEFELDEILILLDDYKRVWNPERWFCD